MSNAMSLKAKIRNIAKQKNIPAQVVLQNYMFERLLIRLSASRYKEKFVLKGGMLVASIVGLDNRATMDLDTTLKNLPLTPEAIRAALEEVCGIAFDDGVTFEIGTISPIREDDIYGGYRVMLNARFDTLLTPLSIDVSTGDAITPHAVPYNFSEIFDEEKSYELWEYNVETVMAEKVETILRRGVFNTRPRDFYDAYGNRKSSRNDAADCGCPRHLAKYRGKPRVKSHMGKIPKTVRLRRGYRVWSDYGCAESAGGVMHSFDADMDCNYL